MNITQERVSLPKLWLESFKVVNRCTGKLVWVILISIGLFALATGVLILTMGTSGILAMAQMGRMSQAAGIGGALAYLLFSVGANIYGIIFWTVCCRLFANQAKEEQQMLPEIFSSSFMPALYQIAAGFLMAIPLVLLGIVAAMLARIHPLLAPLLFTVLFFAVGVRLFYSFIAMAVAGKGPIEGFMHSWKMTAGKNYLDAFLTILMVLGSVLLMYAFFTAIGYGLFILIPLHFAGSFSLAHPSLIWILVAILLGLIAMFCYFVILAFPVLVFLNREATDSMTLQADTSFVQLPGFTLPDIGKNPDYAQDAQTTLRIPRTDVPQDDEPEPDLQVLQSSINTSEEDSADLEEHLNQVYTPKPEDVVQYADEDRMPTILFDDEMAKQLQENQAPTDSPKKDENPDHKDDGPDTVKMSKF